MEKKFELVESLKVGKCCFTGKVFDCGRCQLQPERIKPPCGIQCVQIGNAAGEFKPRRSIKNRFLSVFLCIYT